MAHAHLVFEGTALNDGEDCFDPLDRSCIRYRFEVQRYWKGHGGGEVSIESGVSTCGMFFKKGDSFVVFAYRDDRLLHGYVTNICMGNISSADAAAYRGALGPGYAPATNRPTMLQIAGTGTGAAVLSLVALWITKRRRSRP